MDKFAVYVKISEKIVGHLKKGTSGRFAKTIFYFLRRYAYSSAWAKVTGKRFNLHDGEGMQVPCKLSLAGQPKFVYLLSKKLMILVDFCNVHNLFITNSSFKHPARHITTWENTRINKNNVSVTKVYNQIDYIICQTNKKHIP